MTLGEQIKELRLFHGLTMKQLASRCETSYTAIWNIERDKVLPNPNVLYRIGRALRVRIVITLEPRDETAFIPSDTECPLCGQIRPAKTGANENRR